MKAGATAGVRGPPLLFVWLAALALVAILALGPVLLVNRHRGNEHPPIIVIGSSLMAFAVPPGTPQPASIQPAFIQPPSMQSGAAVPLTPSASLLGDGRPHLRLAIASITEPQLLDHLDYALVEKPALVLLEINPLFVDFAFRANQRPCDGWHHRLRHGVAAGQRRVIDSYRLLRGKPPSLLFTAEDTTIEAEHSIDPEAAAWRYPMTVRTPCDMARLEAAAARARAQDTRIVFILPPRSPDATALIGPAQIAALEARADALAARLGVTLFKPQDEWPNSEFVDTAHMNLRGRAHFLAELQRWWATQP